ncbi:MAG: hypothetical protein MRJ65_06410 [Candidatus Brocadiaceae bacterium]|nr:hypothetical protein [Candidatus Brocadiaceae bacterium]
MRNKILFSITLAILSYQAIPILAVKSAMGQATRLEKAKAYREGNTLGIILKDISTAIVYEEKVGFTSDAFYKQTGKHAAIVRVWLLNLTEKSLKVNPTNFKAVTNNGFILPIHNHTYNTIDPFQSIRLEPKTETQGLIVFALNTSDAAGRIKEIIYDDQNGNRVTRNYNDAVMYGLYDHTKEQEE